MDGRKRKKVPYKKNTAQAFCPAMYWRSGCIHTKNEMTLDCFIFPIVVFVRNFDHPQSRVISVHS